MKTTLIVFSLLVILSSCSAPAGHGLPCVIDSADVLTQTQLVDLKNAVVYLDLKTHDKLGLLTVRNCKPEKDLRTFAGNYFDKNNLAGDSTHHNLLIVFCTECHEVDIHTNAYPDGRLSQAVTKAIVDTIMIPQFKYERHYEGLKRGIGAIIALLDNTDHRKQ